MTISDVVTDGMNKLHCKVYNPGIVNNRLLVFLHGIGENGTNLEQVLKYGPIDQIRDGVDIGPAKDWLIVHPQNPGSTWSISEIDEVIEYFTSNYPVDTDLTVLMGVSLGGLGVWTYAQSPEHVKKLAAIIPICGGGNDVNKASVLVNEGIPGWAAHALNDPVVAYNVTKRMVDAVNDLAGNSQILFSEYGMFGHSAWSYFLRPEYRIYEWIKYQKISNRVKIRQINLSLGDQLVIKVV